MTQVIVLIVREVDDLAEIEVKHVEASRHEGPADEAVLAVTDSEVVSGDQLREGESAWIVPKEILS